MKIKAYQKSLLEVIKECGESPISRLAESLYDDEVNGVLYAQALLALMKESPEKHEFSKYLDVLLLTYQAEQSPN